MGKVQSTSTPPILMDSSYQPHLAYSVLSEDGNTCSLRHAWQTAAGWQVETVAQGAQTYENLNANGFDFLQAPDGTLHLLYDLPGWPSSAFFDAARGPNGWTLTRDDQLYGLLSPAMDARGALVGVKTIIDPRSPTFPLELWTRAGDGTWSTEAVPGVKPATGSLNGPVSLKCGTDGAIHLFVSVPDPLGSATLHLLRRDGSWSAPEVIGRGETAPWLPYTAITLRARDQRLFLGTLLSQGLTLFTQAEGGAWTSQILAPPETFTYLSGQCLDPTGRFILWEEGLGTPVQPLMAVFAEP